MDTVTLHCELGELETLDTLKSSQTRHALMNGLCGNLARAIREGYDRRVYFVTFDLDTSEELQEVFEQSLEEWHYHVVHAVVSTSVDGVFLDAQGLATIADLEWFYSEDIRVIEGTPEMLEAYTTDGYKLDFKTYESLAKQAIELETAGISYGHLTEGEDF